MSRLIQGVVMAAVGVLVFVSLLVPVVSDAQLTAGEETTVNNVIREPISNYSLWDGGDLELSFAASGSTGTYYVNGVEQTGVFDSLTQRIVIASNEICARTAGGTLPGTLNIQRLGDTTGNTYSFTLSIVDGVATFTQLNHDPVILNLDWLVYIDNNGSMNIGTLNVPASPFYTSLTDKVVILGNIYTTGDNDTFYAYYDGELTVNEEYADNSSVTINKTLADGYSDIYNTSVTVNIEDESFTPFFVLAPKTVHGHEASGALYDMLGVLPIVVIAALLLGVLGMVVYQRIE